MTNTLALQLIDLRTTPSLLGQASSESNTGATAIGLGFLVLIVVGAVLYFVPSIVAMARHHPNTAAIVILNLLTGWTFIGWVGSLVWSVTTPQASNTTVVVQSGVTATGAATSPGQSPPGWHPDPHGSGGQRWWDGQAWTNHVQSLPEPPQGAIG